jgi:hypothetical protein
VINVGLENRFWRIERQFYFKLSKTRTDFAEFDWFSIVFGKFLNSSETKKFEFSRRNLFRKKRQLLAFIKLRGANFFSKCSTRRISFNKVIKLIQSFCLLHLRNSFTQNSKQTEDSINEFRKMVNEFADFLQKHLTNFVLQLFFGIDFSEFYTNSLVK